jgi:acetolactate synthase-1/2/3 large subunit
VLLLIFRTTSRKPVLVIGNGAREAGAAEAIYKFIDKTQIPVLTSLNTVDMVQDKDRIGFIGTYGNRTANMIIAECDLLIAVGIRLGIRQIGHKPVLFAPNAYLIRAEIDQAELSRQIKEDEEKHLIDAKEFILKLLEEDIPQYAEWHQKCFRLRDFLEGMDDELGNLVIKKIGDLLPMNPIITVDIGQHMCWVAQSLSLKGRDGRILIGGSYGAMGVGLPYAIGASIYNDKGKAFCIVGDGGLQMNIQELETVAREKLPIKILVINNHALGKISEIQEKAYGRRYAQTTESSGYSVPSFEKIAKAYGIRSVMLSSYETLIEHSSWFDDALPCLIDITLPWETKLNPKIEFDTMEVLPRLDSNIMAEALRIIA